MPGHSPGYADLFDPGDIRAGILFLWLSYPLDFFLFSFYERRICTHSPSLLLKRTVVGAVSPTTVLHPGLDWLKTTLDCAAPRRSSCNKIIIIMIMKNKGI